MPKSLKNRESVNKLDTNIFIKRSLEKHGNKYDYSVSLYKNQYSLVKIICPKHGVFEQLAKSHMNGKGCKLCSNNVKLTTECFIENSKKIHGDKYDYSLVNYVNNKTKVMITCPVHGVFEQRPDIHISKKQGCPKCGVISRTKKQSSNVEGFIEKSIKIHGDRYDYSLVEYKNNKTKVKIKCLNHGVFEQKVINHLNGDGCPYCSNSKGELMVRKLLVESGAYFISQHKFFNCKYKRLLRFDFYLPNLNICIEYDGKQHFEPVIWCNKEKHEELIKKDQIKNEFCYKNNIHLIRIKYDGNIYLNNKIIPLKFKKNMDFNVLIDFVTTSPKLI